MATKADVDLVRTVMSVYRYYCPWLQGIQHSLRLILSGVSQIIIHAKPGTCLGLLRQIIQYFLIYYHGLHLPNHDSMQNYTFFLKH